MPSSPATEKQVALIKKLASEKQVAGTHYQVIVNPESFEILLPSMTKTAASNIIDGLFKLPSKAQAERPVLDEGFYELAGDIYRVVKSKHSDRKYAKTLVVFTNAAGAKCGRWDYAQGIMAKLSESDQVTAEIAATYGHRYGVCCFCGKTLTDPKSVEQGYGPICAQYVA